MPKSGFNSEVFLIVMVIEHVLIVLALFVRNAIPPVPEKVRIELQRRLWYQETLASSARHLAAQNSATEVLPQSQTGCQKVKDTK